MTSLHEGGVGMKSQITHSQLSNIHLLAHTLGTCASISVQLCCFYSLLQHQHVTASHSSPDEQPPERRKVVLKNRGNKQKRTRETKSSTWAPVLGTPHFSRIVAQPPSSFLCCPRPPSHHLSNHNLGLPLTQVALRWYCPVVGGGLRQVNWIYRFWHHCP